jgi:threonine synthase
MKYTSTRNSNISCSFEDAICSGYAPDGGLFVPCKLPRIDTQTLKSWSSLSYPNLAYEVMRMFISPDEISDLNLKKICHDSFIKGFREENKFNNSMDDDDNGNDDENDTIPVKKIGAAYIVELFHGPTFCFKDLGCV